MYAPEVWGGPRAAAAFLDFLADAALGDQRRRPQARAAAPRLLVGGSTPPQPEADYDNGLDAYFGNQCADTRVPVGFLDVPRRSTGTRGPGPGSARYWWWFNAGCADWPVNARPLRRPVDGAHLGAGARRGQLLRRRHRLRRRQATDRLLRNSRLLSYAGWGHTAYGRSECVTGVRRRLPARPARCRRAGHRLPREPEPVPRRAEESLAESPHMVGLPPAGSVQRALGPRLVGSPGPRVPVIPRCGAAQRSETATCSSRSMASCMPGSMPELMWPSRCSLLECCTRTSSVVRPSTSVSVRVFSASPSGKPS